MNIVIVGGGFTGIQLAKLLVNEKNTVSLIENDEDVARHIGNQVDCTVIVDDGNNLEVLETAGIAKADALVCVTSSDEVNMITCSLVDAVYPDVLKIARVRNYAYYVNTASAEKKHANEFAGGFRRPLYGINYMIHPDVEAAEAIIRAVENGAVGNVLTFDDSELELVRINVERGSKLCGSCLKNIRMLTDINFLVAYVEFDGRTYLPSGDTQITEDCILGVLLKKSDMSAVSELCGSKKRELRKVALIGAGRIGTTIAEQIFKPQEKTNFSKIKNFFTPKRAATDFVIIDKDKDLANDASAMFPDARVYCADASDETFLREEGIPDFDLAICATHNHELNMVLAAYLEGLGVKQSISLVTSSEFGVIATRLGVDVAIPLRDTIVDAIMSHLRGKAVKEIHTVSDLEIAECEISPESKMAGKMLKDIADPGKFLVLLVRKPGHENYQIAGGNTQINPGDHIVLIAQGEDSKKVLVNFAGKE
ncbi:MAG: NAD-binding protein [Treponema sp.]|nr:NAD-binding protein [Treponema sp.]